VQPKVVAKLEDLARLGRDEVAQQVVELAVRIHEVGCVSAHLRFNLRKAERPVNREVDVVPPEHVP